MAGYEGQRQSVAIRSSIVPNPRLPAPYIRADIQYPQNRKSYIIKVYVLAVVFICLSAVQWMYIMDEESHREYFKENAFIPFVAAFNTLILLTFFALFNDKRYNPPINMIFGLCIVECATFGMLQIVLNSQLDTLVIYFLVTAAINFAFSILGVILPLDFSKLILPINVISLTVYIAITFGNIFLLTYDINILSWPAAVLIIVLLIAYTMYNAQLISGTRAYMIRLTDFVLPALIAYFIFIVMFVMITILCEYELKGDWPFD